MDERKKAINTVFKPVPTQKELEDEGLLPLGMGQRRRADPYTKMYNRVFSDPLAAKSQAASFNLMAFMVFSLPTMVCVALFGYHSLGLAHFWLMIWVHEAGHGFWCMLGSRTVCAFMGLGNEMLFCLVPAMICLRDRRLRYSAMIFLMWAGLSMAYNGQYMSTAQNPHGTSFAGAITGNYNDMGIDNHDWHIVFSSLGILDYTQEISWFFMAFGKTAAVSLLLSSIIYLLPSARGEEGDFIRMSGAGALLASVAMAFFGEPLQYSALALAFGLPAFLSYGKPNIRPSSGRLNSD